MEILEKGAYLKGLAEGLGLDIEKKEGKLLSVMRLCFVLWIMFLGRRNYCLSGFRRSGENLIFSSRLDPSPDFAIMEKSACHFDKK